MKRLLALAMLFLSGCAVPKEAPAKGGPSDIQVMVVGVWHFDNPGQDVANVASTDVLSLTRQSELETAVSRLAAFRPTLVAVERVSSAPDYLDSVWATFTTDMLKSEKDERVQLGYRLAKVSGAERVVAIDEQPEAGEPDYFPFGKIASAAGANGQVAALEAMIGEAQSMTAAFSAVQDKLSMTDLLIEANEGDMASGAFYYRTVEFDKGEAQPGAELQAYWFMRNAKIFSKLAQVARPGDRVVVVYGAGHKHWLDHFAHETPGFVSIDPVSYLRRATN